METDSGTPAPRPSGPVSKASWPLVGLVVVLLLGVMVFSGWGANLFSDDIDRPSPPCPEEWHEHPRDGICMEEQEVCRIWIQTANRLTRSLDCPALSRDGETYLTIEMSLSRGTAQVVVEDPEGDAMYERDHQTGRGSFALEGAKGQWSLTVHFEGAQGMGTVYLWG